MFKLEGRCWFCGDSAETVDHAKPRSRGGTNRDDNLYPACFQCNNLKSDSTVSEFRKVVRILVCRRLATLGFWRGDWREFPITFFGEGNPHPFTY